MLMTHLETCSGSGHTLRNLGIVVFAIVLLVGCPSGSKEDHELSAPLTSPHEQERLQAIFQGYEKGARALRGVRYQVKRTEDDLVFNTKQIYAGEVVVSNPDLFRV